MVVLIDEIQELKRKLSEAEKRGHFSANQDDISSTADVDVSLRIFHPFFHLIRSYRARMSWKYRVYKRRWSINLP